MAFERNKTDSVPLPDGPLQKIIIPAKVPSRWQHFRPVGVLMLAAMIWGSTFLVTQSAIKLSGPFIYLFLCFGSGAFVLSLIFHRQLVHITKIELLGGLLIGFLLFVSYALQTFGLQYTTSSKSGFITGLYVPLVPIFAFFLLRQRPSRGALIGVALSLTGLFLLSLGKALNFTFGLGELLTLGCALTFTLQIIAVGVFASRVNATNIAIIQLAATSLFNLLAIPFAHETLSLPPLPFWLAVLFMGIGDMAFCYLAMNWAQQFVSSTRASLIYALEPVWAGFFGYLAGQTLSLPAWFGCACIFLGIIAGSLHFHKKGSPLNRHTQEIRSDFP
jgi:drug/metabolite transporter (DMT)-like permease